MSKKSFKDNPALAYLSNTQEVAQKDAHDDTQDVAHEAKSHADAPTLNKQPSAVGAKSDLQRPYVRTQGRKGQKKPRINLAFDSDEFLDEIRIRADQNGMSITQLVNDAVAYYLSKTTAKKAR